MSLYKYLKSYFFPKKEPIVHIYINEEVLEKVNALIKRDTIFTYIGGSLLLLNVIRNMYTYYNENTTIGLSIITWVLNIFNAFIAILQFQSKSKNYVILRDKLVKWFELVERINDISVVNLSHIFIRDKEKLEGSILDYVVRKNLSYLVRKND